MEIPQEILEYCESCFKWNEDIKQELYMKILELPPNTGINKTWCCTTYNNMFKNEVKKDSNRARLREDNYDEIVSNLGLDGTGEDPSDVAEAEQGILKHFNGLSALLRETLIQHYIEGRSPEDIAEIDNENVEAVRKRITRARNLLKGDTHVG